MSNRKQPVKNTSQAYVVNLAEVKIPEYTLSKVKYTSHQWIEYGDTNQFPDFLMKSVKKSTKHSAFISLRENAIKGGGISYSDNIKAFLENLDEDANTIEELVEDWATDLSILETFACFVRYSKNGKKIAAIDFVDSSKVRPAKINQTQEEIDNGELPRIKGYFVCDDWSNTNLNKPVYFEKFNTNKINEKTQLFFYHKRANGQDYLPEISYASCLNYVEMEYETSKFGLNHMLNGFFGSAILNVKASMSDEKKAEFKRSVQQGFTGSENASKLMVVVNEDSDGVKITPLATGDNTAMLQALSDLAEAAICTAHRAQPVLAGIASAGSTLGSDGKLIKIAQELYHNNVIIHLQKPILQFLKKVLNFNGFADYELQFQSLNLVSEDVPEWFLQDYVKPDVLAAKWGYKPEDLVQAPAAPATPAPETLTNPYAEAA